MFSIDFSGLSESLKDIKSELIIQKKIGDFVPKGVKNRSLKLIDQSELGEEEIKELRESICKSS